jgi:1-acyl-sn-glycerol-3-phosphate acyltransferase
MDKLLIDTLLILVIIILLWLGKRSLRAMVQAQQVEWGQSWLNHLDGLNRLFCRHYHRLQHTPFDLPTQGAALLIANHLSGLDPLILMASVRRPLRFLIAREQYERFGFQWFFRAIGCIPVDRGHRPEVALRMALRALEAGEVIALFPQGTFVMPGQSLPLKRGGFWLAQRTGSPIYPAHISGIGAPGYIFLSILWRSKAVIVGHPPIKWSGEYKLEDLQALLEGKVALPILNNRPIDTSQ